MALPIYNDIGKTYDSTRKADPVIVKTLLNLLNPGTSGLYLDLACGSGNYTVALHQQGCNIEGIDISEEMLNKAKLKSSDITWYHGDAASLPFEDARYQGVICTLATHHMANLNQVFQEVNRILPDQGRFIIFTATPEQMQHYWLNEYFPRMIQDGKRKMHSFDSLEKMLTAQGFSETTTYPFFVTHELQDLFLQSGKYRPEIYLDETVRQGISSFHVSANADEITEGLHRLKADIYSGRIDEVIQQYENKIGDYLFISAQKL